MILDLEIKALGQLTVDLQLIKSSKWTPKYAIW